MSEPNALADLIPPEEATEDVTMAEEVNTPAESLPEPAPVATKDEEELPAAEAVTPPVPDADEVAMVPDEPTTDAPSAATDEDETAIVSDAPVGFVNEGLIRWEAARHGWLGARSSDDGSAAKATAVPLDVDKIIDVLFHASSREARASNLPPEKFPRQVPLPQMVDILADLWEAEGLDA
jgi:hypothetical protein